jgi:hypothetical protein
MYNMSIVRIIVKCIFKLYEFCFLDVIFFATILDELDKG